MKYLVWRDVLQAIPLSKYKYWDQTIPLFTKGTYPDGAEASTQGGCTLHGALCDRSRRAEIRKPGRPSG